MTEKAVYACIDPIKTHWQLGPLPPAEGNMTLLGWHCPGRSIDSGIPEEVASLLADALSSISRVSFPVADIAGVTSSEWLDRGEDQVRVLAATGLLGRAQAAMKRMPTQVTLLTTRRARAIQRLFDDPEYPWHLQSQIALLSPPDAAPPAVNRETLLALVGDDWMKDTGRLHSIGISGLLRPGVDGDVIGVFSLTDDFTQTLLDAVERHAQLAGFHWLQLSEEDFSNRL